MQPPRAFDQARAVARELPLAHRQRRCFRRRWPEAAQGPPGDHQPGQDQAQSRGEEGRLERQRQQVLAASESGEREIEHDRQVLPFEACLDDLHRQLGAARIRHAVIVHEVRLGHDDDRPARRVELLRLGIAWRHPGGRVEHRVGAAVVEIAGENVARLIDCQRQHVGRVQRQHPLRHGKRPAQPQPAPAPPLPGLDLGLVQPIELLDPGRREVSPEHDPSARHVSIVAAPGREGKPFGQDQQGRSDIAPRVDDFGEILAIGEDRRREHQQGLVVEPRGAARERDVVSPRLDQPGEPGEAVEAVRRCVRAAVAIAAPVPASPDRVEQQQERAGADREHRQHRARREGGRGAAHARPGPLRAKSA